MGEHRGAARALVFAAVAAAVAACSFVVDTSGLAGSNDVVDASVVDSPIVDAPSEARPGNGEAGDASDRVVDLPSEQVHVAAGWTIRIFRDISKDYTYRALDFQDVAPAGPEDNRPRGVVALVAPFADGFATLVGRKILETRSNGSVVVHDYTPSAPGEGSVPDVPNDLSFVRPTPTTGSLLVSAGSYGGGDGVFAIDATWAMTLAIIQNNCGAVAFDGAGLFDGKGTPQTYYATYDSALLRDSDKKVILSNSMGAIDGVSDLEVESSGRLAVAMNLSTGNAQIGEIQAAGGTYPLRKFASTVGPVARLVTGDLARLPNAIHFVNGTRLALLHGDDTQTVLAETKTDGWTWTTAASLPKDHSLGATTTYVIIESNRVLGLDRLLLLSAAP